MAALPHYAYFEGQIVPYGEAKIGVLNQTLHYGTGCFGGLRAYWNTAEQQAYVFRPADHFRRFLNSAKILCMHLEYTPTQLIDIVLELLRLENCQEDMYIRPLAYKADEAVGVRLHDLRDAVLVVCIPMGPYMNEEGAHVTFSSWRRVDDNAIPARGKITGAYANSAFIKTEAHHAGFDEALVLTQDGHISEGSAANFFLVRDGVAYTPPVTDNVLEGITRRTVMQLLRDELGVAVVERSLDRSEVYVADEAWFCGTGVQIAAITQIDHRPIGTGQKGPVVQKLRDLYFQVVRGQVAKYKAWCVPVFQK